MRNTNIDLDRREDGILILSMITEQAMNVLSRGLVSEMQQALYDSWIDPEIRVIILTGKGRVFCAGADLGEYVDRKTSQLSATPLSVRPYLRSLQEMFSFIEDLEKPVIAAINGYALGGGLELALACDFRVISETAEIGTPEVNIGGFPGGGALQRLPRIIGRSKTLEITLLGKRLTALDAEKLGLVYKCVPPQSLMLEATKLAQELANKSPVGIAYAKNSLNIAMDVDIKNSSRYGLEAMGMCFSSGDSKEGIFSFLEKRSPKFPGFQTVKKK